MTYNFDITKKINEKLNEYDIECIRLLKKDDSEMLSYKNFNIVCKINEIFIHFDIATKPSYSVRIMLLINDIIDENMIISVGEDYHVDESLNLLTGIDAYEKYKNEYKNNIINEFLKEQSEIYILQNTPAYHC